VVDLVASSGLLDAPPAAAPPAAHPDAMTYRLTITRDGRTSTFTFDDDGASFDHEAGRSSRVTFTTQRTASGARLAASPREGSFVPAKRGLVVRVRPVDHAVTSATLDGAPVPFAWDANDRAAVVSLDDHAPFELVLAFDPARAVEPTNVELS